MPVRSASLLTYVNDLDGVTKRIEFSRDGGLQSPGWQAANATARGFANAQSAFDSISKAVNSAQEAVAGIQGYLSSLASYLSELGGPVTLTTSLQSLGSITVVSAGTYLVDAAVSLDYRNNDVVSIELDVNGAALTDKIAVSSTVAAFQLTTVVPMHWIISAGDSTVLELKGKKTSGSGASAVQAPTVLRALRIA